MDLTLKIWRQNTSQEKGRLESYKIKDIEGDSSFLEMLDKLNDELEVSGVEAVTFDHDCREGICGSCSLVINGVPHGPERGTTTCQLHMRHFKDGDTIVIEPWRAKAFPVIKDLMVNRSAFDRVIQAGGYVSINTGGTPDANSIRIPKSAADAAMDAAECIGCGACVAACKNASAMLFVGAKATHLGTLPQGEPETAERAMSMVRAMDREGFGNCTNQYECEAACPKEISIRSITKLNKDFIRSSLLKKE